MVFCRAVTAEEYTEKRILPHPASDSLSNFFLMKQKGIFNPLHQLSWQWNADVSGLNPGLCTRKGGKS